MSVLITKISAKETELGIVVNELTGKYCADNQFGWGAPNPPLSSVTSAQFEIYPPDATSPAIVNVFPDYPTDDPCLGYEILTAQIGVKFLTSGLWRIGYRVKGVHNNIPYEKYTEVNEVFTCQAECCVDKLNAKTLNVPVNVFMKDEKKRAAVELRALMNDALLAKKHGNVHAAGRILKFINMQCECC